MCQAKYWLSLEAQNKLSERAKVKYLQDMYKKAKRAKVDKEFVFATVGRHVKSDCRLHKHPLKESTMGKS
jgi:hypothetical protein